MEEKLAEKAFIQRYIILHVETSYAQYPNEGFDAVEITLFRIECVLLLVKLCCYCWFMFDEIKL